MNTFGKRLQTLRKERHLTQRELALIFNIGHGTIAMWETDKTEPDINTIKKIAKYFYVSIDYLLNKNEEILLKDEIQKFGGIPFDGQQIKIPVLGSVKAGIGGLWQEELQGYELVSAKDINGYDSHEFFWLIVSGESMSPQLLNNDLVLVHKQTSVDSGTLAVVSIDNEEAVVKRIIYTKNSIELISFNPYYPPRHFENGEVERVFVIGKVKKSLRNW